MRVGYFINIYPKVSHSFIRREILALEEQGLSITRYALRVASDELVDDDDRREAGKTHFVLGAGLREVPCALVALLWERPVQFLQALYRAMRMGWRSDRGLFLHMAYFVEACILSRWLRRDKVEHLHAHFGTNPAAIAYLVHALGGPEYSFTVHGPEEFDKPEFLGLTEKMRTARFVVAISSYGRSQLYRWLDTANWSKVHVVHCALGADFLASDVAPMTAAPRLVCVGRLCEQKGQLLLVRAVRHLVQAGIGVEVVLAGDGPLRQELEAYIRAHALERYVRITGWIDAAQVRAEINAARALVLPSFAEGLPVVIMEALALGRPALSTYVAGIPELVLPGINGWLMAPGCKDALIDAMRDALQATPEQLTRMGLAGRQRVMERHAIAREAKHLAELFMGKASSELEGGFKPC